jgi:plastocyanin
MNPVSTTVASMPVQFSITNAGACTHTWNIVSTGYSTGSISVGSTATGPSTTLAAGTYTLGCSFHAGMTGTLSVT